MARLEPSYRTNHYTTWTSSRYLPLARLSLLHSLGLWNESMHGCCTLHRFSGYKVKLDVFVCGWRIGWGWLGLDKMQTHREESVEETWTYYFTVPLFYYNSFFIMKLRTVSTSYLNIDSETQGCWGECCLWKLYHWPTIIVECSAWKPYKIELINCIPIHD